MSKPSVRKREKKKARNEAQKKWQRTVAEKRKYTATFPELVYETNNAPTEFVALVQKAIKNIDMRDRHLFEPVETEFFKYVKRNGADIIVSVRDKHR